MWMAHVLWVQNKILMADFKSWASYKTSLNMYVHGLPYRVMGIDPFGEIHTFYPIEILFENPVNEPTNPTQAKFTCGFHALFDGW